MGRTVEGNFVSSLEKCRSFKLTICTRYKWCRTSSFWKLFYTNILYSIDQKYYTTIWFSMCCKREFYNASQKLNWNDHSHCSAFWARLKKNSSKTCQNLIHHNVSKYLHRTLHKISSKIVYSIIIITTSYRATIQNQGGSCGACCHSTVTQKSCISTLDQSGATAVNEGFRQMILQL